MAQPANPNNNPPEVTAIKAVTTPSALKSEIPCYWPLGERKPKIQWRHWFESFQMALMVNYDLDIPALRADTGQVSTKFSQLNGDTSVHKVEVALFVQIGEEGRPRLQLT